MKYKITRIVHKKSNKNSVVEFSTLYDFGIFCEREEASVLPYRKKTSRLRLLVSALFLRASRLFAAFRLRIARRISALRSRPENKLLLPSLCGALCAYLLVTAISFGIVGYKLFIEDYFGRYTTVTVPDFVGARYPEDELIAESDYCNIDVSYEYNNDAPAGVVISQTPSPKVTRRVYRKKSNCNVSLVVSLGKKTYTMPSLEGESLRDARLTLKNAGVKFSVSEAYSDSVQRGKILSTSPAPSETFYADGKVSLVVSLGARKIYKAVPQLFGMNESRASAALRSAGLSVGKISYESSELPLGTVIAQSHKAYSYAEEGEAVSFTVSAGQKFSEKRIPDLHGLTIDEARERLSEVGLVLGKVYAVANAAPRSTVVAQSLLPDLPIQSDIYSVDVYVSS